MADPLEVALVHDVKSCRICKWFWMGTPPYGPYPAFDWLTDFPPEAVRSETQPSGYTPAQPWLSAALTGSTIPDPGVMHGCRKAPIMTVGINPNMTAWFPYTSSAPWIYPAFSKDARYAYYYRHFTLYQESLSPDFVRSALSSKPEERLIAEDDGYVTGSSREDSHNYIQLNVRYRGQAADTVYEIVWKPDERWVVVQAGGSPTKPLWFKKGDVLAGRFDPPKQGTAEIYENAAGYYQRMVPVLERFKALAGLAGANLTIGEDIAQHDMVACASPGWQSKFDMPMERIAANCVSNKGFIVSQFVQSQPVFLILVSTSALAMFRSVFGPFMTLPPGGDVYQLLVDTCRRPTYVTIAEGPVQFKTRIIVSPHFSYPDGFLAGARLSEDAWKAFEDDFRADAWLLKDGKHVYPDPEDQPGPYLVTLAPNDALRDRMSVRGRAVLDGYYVDPFELMAQAMADEFKAGTIAFDPRTGHLRRGAGPCRFCVNDQWQFPEGCAYRKPDEPPLPAGQLEDAVKSILAKASQAALAEAARDIKAAVAAGAPP